jgi:methyl-accepting chemotaxis protein
MKNFKMKKKLIVGFLLAAIVTAIVGTVGMVSVFEISKDEDTLYKRLTETRHLGEAGVSLQRIRINYRDIIIFADDHEKLDAAIASMDVNVTDLQNDLDFLNTSFVQKKNIELIGDVLKAFTVFKDSIDTIKEYERVGDKQGLINTMSSTYAHAEALQISLDALIENIDRISDALNSSDTSKVYLLLWILIIVIVVGVAIAMVLGIYLANSINKPLRLLHDTLIQIANTGDMYYDEAVVASAAKYEAGKDELAECIHALKVTLIQLRYYGSMMQAVAGKDLDVDLNVLGDRDLIGNSLETMIRNLSDIVSEIYMSTSQISIASEQIASGSQNLASGANEQAGIIQQFNSLMVEIQEMAKANAEVSSEVGNDAEDNTRIMLSNIGDMEKISKAMEDITQSSQKIESVIKVIDDIAFQTNILALNAAVEAARAGESGRGFAVVADEVRELASKSAEAAKETSALIASSLSNIDEGNIIVRHATESIAEIGEIAKKNASNMNKLSESSEKQSDSISKITTGISQISVVVESNSALAEESAAAAQTMAAEAARLNTVVKTFKLEDSNTTSYK